MTGTAGPAAGRTGLPGRLAALSLGHDFDRLWLGSAVSQLGSQVGTLAVSLTAVITLHATAAQMGLLSTVARLPWLTYPVAGVFVDRLRRRPLMIAADLLRAGLLVTVPLAAALGALRIPMLYAVLFLAMALGVWFDTASAAFVPATVGPGRLTAANGRLAATSSAARIAGPGLGGLVVQAVTAPFAILVDAASFLFSAAMIARVPGRPAGGPARRPAGIVAEMAGGFRYLAGQPVLRALALLGGLTQFAGAMLLAVNLLYLTRELHVPPAAIGLAVSGAGPGTLLGSVVAGRVANRLGPAATLIGGWLGFGAGALLIPLAPSGAPLLAAGQVMLAGVVMGLSGQTSGIVGTTIAQSIPPDHLRGRVLGSVGFLSLGVAPAGALTGGLLGGVVGLRQTTLAAALLMLAVPLLGAFTAVRRLPRRPAGEPA